MAILIFVAIVVGLLIMEKIGLGNMILIAWLLLGLMMFLVEPKNPLVFIFGVMLPVMVFWDTRETKKQSRRRPGRLSTVRRGSSKEYDQGWEAASQGISYEKAPYDRTTKQGKEWRMGHNHYRDYEYVVKKKRIRNQERMTGVSGIDKVEKEYGKDAKAGWEAAISGKNFNTNPYPRFTDEYNNWARGHNQYRYEKLMKRKGNTY